MSDCPPACSVNLNIPQIRVRIHHDTTTFEIGLVTSPRCQTETHWVHERNLSTRIFVGILGPLRSNRQYRIVSIDQSKSRRVVFTNFENHSENGCKAEETSSSETQGQLVGGGKKSKRARKKIGRRKVKNEIYS